MSDSEDEVFDLDVSGSESDGYAPAPKKTAKAAPKKTASKTASKPAAKPAAKTTKKKNVADKENDGSDVEMDSDVDMAGPSLPAVTKKKTASETYQKVSISLKVHIDASQSLYLRLDSSHNSNTFSNDQTRTLGAWRRLLRACGYGTRRTRGW